MNNSQREKQIYFELIFDEIEPKIPSGKEGNQEKIIQYQKDLEQYEQKLYKFYKKQFENCQKYEKLEDVKNFDYKHQMKKNNAFWLYTNKNECNQDYQILFKTFMCYGKRKEFKIQDIRYQQSESISLNLSLRIVKFSKMHDKMQLSLLHFSPNIQLRSRAKKEYKDQIQRNYQEEQNTYQQIKQQINESFNQNEQTYIAIESDDDDDNEIEESKENKNENLTSIQKKIVSDNNIDNNQINASTLSNKNYLNSRFEEQKKILQQKFEEQKKLQKDIEEIILELEKIQKQIKQQ